MSDSSFQPVALKKDEQARQLIIDWNDGTRQEIGYRQLRDSCPCAHCLDKRMKKSEPNSETAPEATGILPILSAAEVQPLDIVSMKPIGNYAYGIQFSDGHSSGIYSMGFLRSMISVTAERDTDASNSGTN